MSCEIRPIACIVNVSAIKRILFPTDDQRGGDSWLQTCKLSASPTGDIIVIANERRLVILTSKWDSTTSLSLFHLSHSETVHEYDKVKAVLCLPIVGQSHSSHVGPDWTCIVLGYDSGYVRFYTETCDLLFEEQFHNENITSIKCQSQHSPRPDISPELHLEELYIQYQSNVCVINGQQFLGNLKTLRSHLARVQAKGSPIEFQQTPLNIKKWGFQDQASINDVTVVGLNMSSTFDHLLTASTCGGFDSKYRNTAPNSTLVLAAGSKPFLAYHYALEGVNQPVLSDVAKAVASKLKSALPGWLTGTKPNQEKDITVAMHPVDSMGLRFGLCDLRRTGTEVILSPNKKLAAVTDTLGRVVLMDSFRGIAIKVFKGYREAQCAFLQVPDERRSKHRIGNKVAHFLIIYSPKKGSLEIFTVQQGTKIATFSASKHSRLLYITHGLMGFTTSSKSRYICQFTCIFVDNDGQIKEVLVPFHFAVAEKNSKRARDIHLYKKLRQFIKCGELDMATLQNESYNICMELKTVEVTAQTLDMLLNSRNVSPEIISSCVDYFLENFVENVGNEATDNFRNLCKNVRSLLDLYLFVTTTDDREHFDDDDKKYAKESNKTLILEDKELRNLQKLLDLATSTNDNDLKISHVRFSDKDSFTVSDFMGSFDLTKPEGIVLKANLEEDVLFRTSEVLFKKYVSGENSNFEEFTNAILSSGVSIKNLFDLVIHFWVNRALDINSNLEKDLNSFFNTVAMLVKIASKEITANFEGDNISSFWENIRNILGNSSRPFPALMAAMLCKNVAQKYELENSEENIEVLSQENVQWSLLIGKLEDVSTLNIILSSRPHLQSSSLPKLSYNKVEISLKYILQNGRGSVSESTAQWLTSCGMDPQNIVVNEIIYKNCIKDSFQLQDEKVKSEKNENTLENTDDIQIPEGMHLEIIEQVKSDPIFKYLNLLKQQFPYSLESSTLVANMCWEYALSWRKDICNLEHLKSALKCLNSITDRFIKQGLFQLVWNTHLKIVAESSCKLINKVGKLPKERLCQQDTGLTDKQITVFIGICSDFLDSFLDVAQSAYDSEKPVLNFEAIWENGGPRPLVELAVQQKEVDYNLLHLHYQLSLVLYMITKFVIKHSKPVNNLFEASIATLFFTDFQRKVDINWNKSDIKINSSRMQFLRKIITASLETITLSEDGQIYCKEHVEWMDKCLTLARIWNLDVDDLKRFQISQLYVSGYDLVAQELIPAVNELDLLGEELLKVAGKRLSQYLSSSPNLSENITALSPALSRYIDSLNGEWCSPGNLKNIIILTTQAYHCLSEEQEEHYKLAELLLDACNTLEEINNE